ncbi:MAG: radical SAM family heme chaperone HemW [Neptuniibacter sp.]
MGPELPPLSLYVHIPWCVRKCPYCDFNSHAVRDEIPEEHYIRTLIDDLQSEVAYAQGREIESIFIGGGTPSLFSGASYQLLLEEINRLIPIKASAEITIEANPGTFEQEKFASYKDAGINRLSIGIQSFNDQHLKELGRIHSGKEAIHAISLAREIFPNINLDLMHGLPGQSLDNALADLDQAISLQPNHLSWYQLTIEPNTEFHAKPPSLPVDETLWTIQEHGQARIADAGFSQYEISAYAKEKGKRSRHNLNYWTFGDYLGIGAGAHGKITLLSEQKVLRRWKQKQPKAYMEPSTRLQGCEAIAENELGFEFMLNVLRLSEGVPCELFTDRTGLALEQVQSEIAEARRRKLLVDNAEIIKPTTQGRLFLNDLLGIFL